MANDNIEKAIEKKNKQSVAKAKKAASVLAAMAKAA
jgi:hypothetical protein